MSDGDEVRDLEDGGSCVLEDFKLIINQYDRTVVDSLMPFMVNLLDCMNVGYKEKLKYEAKLQKTIKDNLSLQNKEKRAKKALKQELQEYIAKYEAERESKVLVERKLAEFEKKKDKDSKTMISRVEALEIHVRSLEKKFKHSTDCIQKLEEREAYLKREYSELLERYTKLFREHVDYLEKSKGTRRHRELALNEELADVHKARQDVEPDNVFTLVDASGNENETVDGENYIQIAAEDNPNIHYDHQYFEKQSKQPHNTQYIKHYFEENSENNVEYYEGQTDKLYAEEYIEPQNKLQKDNAFYQEEGEYYKEDNRFDTHQYVEQNDEAHSEYRIEEINLIETFSPTESIKNINVAPLE